MKPVANFLLFAGLALLAAPVLGCGKRSSGAAASAKPSAAAAPAAPASAARAPTVSRGATVPRDVPMPSGPMLAILAGQGVGPIRLGANMKTVERLMERPCDVREEKLCRYVGAAVEYFFDAQGKLERVHVHRPGRLAPNGSAGKPPIYGMFHGAIPPDLKMTMLPWAVQQHLGKPLRVEPVAKGGASFTQERHHYKGMVLEYDRLDNGNLVLGGVIVQKP